MKGLEGRYREDQRGGADSPSHIVGWEVMGLDFSLNFANFGALGKIALFFFVFAKR